MNQNLLQLSEKMVVNLDHITSMEFLPGGQVIVYLNFAYLHKASDEVEKAFLYLEGVEAANMKTYVQRDVRRADAND